MSGKNLNKIKEVFPAADEFPIIKEMSLELDKVQATRKFAQSDAGEEFVESLRENAKNALLRVFGGYRDASHTALIIDVSVAYQAFTTLAAITSAGESEKELQEQLDEEIKGLLG
jgi:hypothetical protein